MPQPLALTAWNKPGHALQTAIACAIEQAKRGPDGRFLPIKKPREIVTEILRHYVAVSPII